MLSRYIHILIITLVCQTLLAQEGVSTKIDSTRLNEVMEWVENAKYTLDVNLDNIQRSSVTEQEARYEDVIETILRQSGDRPNEFLMRNVLHRAKIVYAGIKHVPSSPKRDVLARRILEDAVMWAKRLYEPDMNLMKLAREGKLTEVLRGTEFAKLGIEWADYMLNLYYLAPTSAVKLQLMQDLMGIMYNDINNDDAVKRLLAPISGAVVIKHRELQNINPLTPVEKLRVARDLRRFIEQQLVIVKELLKYSPPVINPTSVVYRDVENRQTESTRSSRSTRATWVLNIGDIVINQSTYYKIVGIVGNNYKIADLKYNSISSSTYSESELAKTHGVSGYFTLGETVIYGSTYYNVVGITKAGNYKIADTRYKTVAIPTYSDSELVKTSGSGKSFKVGDEVIYGSTRYKIVGITRSGAYRIADARHGTLSSATYSASELARTR